MKTKKFLLMLPALLLFWSQSNTSFATDGSGNIVTEKRSVSDFQGVSIEGAGLLYIQQGTHESLEIEADDNLLPLIKTSVSGNTLQIKHKWFSSLNPSQPIIYRLSLKSLASLETSGSLKIFSTALRVKHLAIGISGSSQIVFERLEGNALDLEISGSGEVSLNNGKLVTQTISITGSGLLHNENIKTKELAISISGSGDASVWVTRALNVSISGSGELSYYGKPEVRTDISGSGKISPLGLK